MKNGNHYAASLRLIRSLFVGLSLILFFIQIVVDTSWENIVCNLLVEMSFIPVCLVTFSEKNRSMEKALISTILFLTVAANSFAPALGTLIEGVSLTNTLLVPVETFFHRYIFSWILILSFVLSINRSNLLLKVSKDLGNKFKTNIIIPQNGILAFGLLGLFFFLLKVLPLPNFVVKIMDAFNFLLWAPFLLLLPPYSSNGVSKRIKYFLIFYYLVMVALALISNSRMGMIGPIAMIAASWLVTVIIGTSNINLKTLRKGMLLALSGILFLGILSDLSTAILIERAYRSTRTFDEQFSATVVRYFDKKSLDNYSRQLQLISGASSDIEWQENYVRNPFLGRFIQIKFDDNLLFRIKKYSPDSYRKLEKQISDRVWSMLPTPVISIFNSKVNKEEVSTYSTGDYMDVLSGQGSLGGFKTGSIPAHAFALFGWYYPLVLVSIYTFIFSIYGGLVSRRQLNQISTFGLLITFSLFTAISLDSVSNLIGILIRGVWQTALIFSLTMFLFKKIGIVKYRTI